MCVCVWYGANAGVVVWARVSPCGCVGATTQRIECVRGGGAVCACVWCMRGDGGGDGVCVCVVVVVLVLQPRVCVCVVLAGVAMPCVCARTLYRVGVCV